MRLMSLIDIAKNVVRLNDFWSQIQNQKNVANPNHLEKPQMASYLRR